MPYGVDCWSRGPLHILIGHFDLVLIRSRGLFSAILVCLVLRLLFGGAFWCRANSVRRLADVVVRMAPLPRRRLWGVTLGLRALFVVLLATNLLGLLPYAFSLSSQPVFAFTVGLGAWLAIVTSGVSYQRSHFFRHLVPHGAPNALAPGLILVEAFRALMRPVTLVFRLVANITAGHLIVVVVAKMALVVSHWYMAIIPFFGLVLVYVLEVAVAFIQRYVFVLLLGL